MKVETTTSMDHAIRQDIHWHARGHSLQQFPIEISLPCTRYSILYINLLKITFIAFTIIFEMLVKRIQSRFIPRMKFRLSTNYPRRLVVYRQKLQENSFERHVYFYENFVFLFSLIFASYFHKFHVALVP